MISEKTNLPLVLHGGSGLSDDDFLRAVKLGVSKVNIFTDIDKAGKCGIEAGIAAGETSVMGLIPYEIAGMKKVVKEKIMLFGSNGRQPYEEAMRRMESGELKIDVKYQATDEMGRLADSLRAVLQFLQDVISDVDYMLTGTLKDLEYGEKTENHGK